MNYISSTLPVPVPVPVLILKLFYWLFKAGLWIRIRIGSGFIDFVDPDPYWESGSRIRIQGQERNFRGKMHFLVGIFNKILTLERYKIALTTF
jgi:hypothetical protein